MIDELHSLIARKVRDRLRLRLGPNALDLAQRGAPVTLNSGEADQVADAVVEVLADLQLAEQEADVLRGRFDSRHYPHDATEIVYCSAHLKQIRTTKRLPRLEEWKACPDCTSRKTVACRNMTCCDWPCADHLSFYDETEQTCTHRDIPQGATS